MKGRGSPLRRLRSPRRLHHEVHDPPPARSTGWWATAPELVATAARAAAGDCSLVCVDSEAEDEVVTLGELDGNVALPPWGDARAKLASMNAT